MTARTKLVILGSVTDPIFFLMHLNAITKPKKQYYKIIRSRWENTVYKKMNRENDKE